MSLLSCGKPKQTICSRRQIFSLFSDSRDESTQGPVSCISCPASVLWVIFSKLSTRLLPSVRALQNGENSCSFRRQLVLVRWLVDGVPSDTKATRKAQKEDSHYIFAVSYYSHYIRPGSFPCPATHGGSWKGRWSHPPVASSTSSNRLCHIIRNIFPLLTPVPKPASFSSTKKWPSRLRDSFEPVDWNATYMMIWASS